jgi:hypothetical protein
VDERIVIALVAAVSAVVGGLISTVLGPVIRHHLAQSAADQDRRRNQIQAWRDMILYIDRHFPNELDVGSEVQAHADFLTLEPYLSDEVRQSIYRQNTTLVVGSTLAKQLRDLAAEISRVEKKWGLRK